MFSFPQKESRPLVSTSLSLEENSWEAASIVFLLFVESSAGLFQTLVKSINIFIYIFRIYLLI